MRKGLLIRMFLYLFLPAGIILWAFVIEPRWLEIKTITLSSDPSCKIIHITDLHYKGDERLLQSVVGTINEIGPDIVCLTGDIAEKAPYYREAMRRLSDLQSPLFCIPGNHDPTTGPTAEMIEHYCRMTGGKYLINEIIELKDYDLCIIGASSKDVVSSRDDMKNQFTIVLTHYPEIAAGFDPGNYDLALAGHSHGGQIRLPFIGALVLPHMVGAYDMGMYDLSGSKLYVNRGIGTFVLPARFLCRPEITVIEI